MCDMNTFSRSIAHSIGASLLALAVVSCGGEGGTETTPGNGPVAGNPPVTPNPPPVTPIPSDAPPEFDAWKSKMLTYGRIVGEGLLTIDINSNDALDETYYDGQRVFFQIADFTGQGEPWLTYAQRAELIYRNYLVKNNHRAGGYMNFGHGLYEDWVRYRDINSYNDLTLLNERAAYGDAELICPNYQLGSTANNCPIALQKYSREIAYALQTNILVERAGVPRNARRVQILVDLALNHINIWTTGQFLDSDPRFHFVQAFMTGLTASALIDYYERTVTLNQTDARIPPKLKTLADWVWDNMWVANVNNTGFGAFKYVMPTTTGVGSDNPAPDLNQLIAPYYAWLYQQTCDVKYRQRSDLIFAGGARLADLTAGKRFNQSYRASFDYLRWRDEGDKKCK